jgi:hypothetical protein
LIEKCDLDYHKFEKLEVNPFESNKQFLKEVKEFVHSNIDTCTELIA